MSIDNEQLAYKLYEKAIKKLFKENYLESYNDLCIIMKKYSTTHISLKAMFIATIINMTQLSVECMLADAFLCSAKGKKLNIISDLFNKDLNFIESKYEYHAQKRLEYFKIFKKNLNNLLNNETHAVVYSYIELSKERLAECNPLNDLNPIKKGEILEDNEIEKILKKLYFYNLVSFISNDFNLEYTNQLSSKVKRKLLRPNFYSDCLNWILKFNKVIPGEQNKELIKRCCGIIIGHTYEDSTNPKRIFAYKILSSMLDNYYGMVDYKNSFKEIVVEDIECILMDKLPTDTYIDDTVIKLISEDKRIPDEAPYSYIGGCNLALELEPNSFKDIININNELSNDNENNDNKKTFPLNIEFE